MAATRITTQDIKDAAVTGAKLNVLSTKGDLLVFDTAHTRLPIGTDGFVLVADAASTPGMKWAAGVTASSFVFSEVPSGTVNGSNATFTLANTPTSGTVRVMKNGMRQQVGAGNDFTISGGTITFLSGNIPQTGDVLLVDYNK